MSKKTAGIIIIGDEVLKGHVPDKNIHVLCRGFHNMGVEVRKVSIISDNIDEISEEVSAYSKLYSIVVTTGGVGPTHDDVTYEGVAKAFREPLQINKDLLSYFQTYVAKDFSDSALRMVRIPENAETIFVPLSQQLITIEGTHDFPVIKMRNIFIFPGVPAYVQVLFDGIANKYFNNMCNMFYCRKVYLNKSENELVPLLNKVVNQFQKTVTFGSYPECGLNPDFETKITIESTNMEACIDAETAFLMHINPCWLTYNHKWEPPNLSLTQHLVMTEHILTQPLRDAIQIIEECFDKYSMSNMFISFNGGKDCMVVLHLLYYVYHQRRNICHSEPIKAIYFKSEDSFSEQDTLVQEVKQLYKLDLVISKTPMKESLGAFLKHDPHRTVCFLGVRNSDPTGKNMHHIEVTDNGWPKMLRVFPVIKWNYRSVWTFLRSLNVPYCSLYNLGYTSIGTKSDTEQNTYLKYTDNSVTSYRPAYLLEECSKEREGRM